MTTYTKGKSVKLTKNFKSTEFDCKGKGCCSKTLIDIELVGYLQVIRNYFGKAVTINSGYRCQKHNKNVGGAKNSRHTQGMAADIVVKCVKPLKVAQFAETIGIRGIGLYDTFVHIDSRESKFYWKGQAQKSVKTFK
jgi:uncharacterized protein YcbK (DUF882 family)